LFLNSVATLEIFASSSCSKDKLNRLFIRSRKSKPHASLPREHRLTPSRFRTNAPSSRQVRSRLHLPQPHKLEYHWVSPCPGTMASSTPTRRVLSDLNVNTPTARAAMQPCKLEAHSSVKLRNVGDISFQAEIRQDARAAAGGAAILQETWMGSNKRCSDVSSDGLPNKRVKTTPRPKVVSERVLPDPRGRQTFESGIDDAPVLQSPPLRVRV
jgi:hypothetical protein